MTVEKIEAAYERFATDCRHLTQLKYIAKLEKRERGIRHSYALEIVAERLGFIDYENAREVLGNNTCLRAAVKDLEMNGE